MKQNLPPFALLVLFFIFVPLHSALATDTTRTEVGPGVTYIQIHNLSTPLHTVALEIDLAYPENKITTVLANDRLSAGNELVENMSKRKTGDGHLVVGALNGDYFSFGAYTKLADGQIKDNEYIFGGHRNRSSFGMTSDGKPFVDIVNFAGEIDLGDDETYPINGMNAPQDTMGLILYNYYTGNNTRSDNTATEWLLTPISEIQVNKPITFEVEAVERHVGNMAIPEGSYVLTGGGDVADSLYAKLAPEDQVVITKGIQVDPTNPLADKGIAELMGGGPRLVTNGERATSEFVGYEGFGQNHSGERHTRTAVGYNQDSTKVYFVVVDGRQHYSRGATMREMADVMIGFGAWEAVNLDGGGSSTLIVRDEPKNDHDIAFGFGTYRPVANALLAVVEVSYSDIADHVLIDPQEVVIDSAGTVSFSAQLIDQWDYPLPGTESEITWELVGLDGELSSNGTFTSGDYSEGYVVAHYGEFSDSAWVAVKEPVSVAPSGPDIPEAYALKQNYPNPFNPDTRIEYDLPESSHVRITVYDVLGRPVAVLRDQQHQAGTYSVRFDAGNLSSGTYIYEITAGNFIERRKMMLVK